MKKTMDAQERAEVAVKHYLAQAIDKAHDADLSIKYISLMEDLYERLKEGETEIYESINLDRLEDLLKDSVEIARRTDNEKLWKYSQKLLTKVEKERIGTEETSEKIMK